MYSTFTPDFQIEEILTTTEIVYKQGYFGREALTGLSHFTCLLELIITEGVAIQLLEFYHHFICTYHIVASSNTSCLALYPGPGIFRLLTKGIFDAYVL